MRLKVYIRADGNSQIGLGHLVRCLALGHMLKDDFEIYFVCKEIPKSLEFELRQSGFSLVKIHTEGHFFALLNKHDIVILDHYGLDGNYQKQIKEIGCKLVCIDDLYDKEFYADLIINHSPGINPEAYKAQPYTEFALGPQYALLRKSFLLAAKENRQIKSIDTVFICFGGADPINLTLKILKVALYANVFKKVIVVTGSAYSHIQELESFLSSYASVSHYNSVNEIVMAKLLQQSDLSIIPASGILFEALACGCSVITSYYIDNQKEIFNGFRAISTATFVNDFNDIDERYLQIFSENYKFLHCKSMIDGSSDKRIQELIKKM